MSHPPAVRRGTGDRPPLSLAQAAGRRPQPATWDPESGRAWRAGLARDVEEGLRLLWAQATSATGARGGPEPRGHSSLAVGGAVPAGVLAATPAEVLTPGLALACVGSLARREAGPASDLDLVLLTDGRTDEAVLTQTAERLWYPLWDAGTRLDHSVRTIAQCRTVASHDLPAALGLLDLRHVAGDPGLTQQAASALLADWRSATRQRLPDLAQEAAARAATFGEVAGLLEPDLKEARGGLRDAVLVRGLTASSLADRPHGELDRAMDSLLNVRDALALATGRPTSRLVQAYQDEVAETLGLRGPDARDRVLTQAYEAGREVAAALDSTMRSALRAARPARRPLTLVRFGRRHAPVLENLDQDVISHGGEVALADHAAPEDDPALPLRVALASVRTGQPVATVTRASLGRCPVPTGTWRDEPAAREGAPGASDRTGPSTMLASLIELLCAGDALVRVWEDLDLAGLPARWLPGWSQVRNRPQHNPLHLYTVDRHMVRTAATAGRLLGSDGGATVLTPLGLPPLDASTSSHDRSQLLLASLLHDLGKVPGVVGQEHAAAGADRLPGVLSVLGADRQDTETVTLLVREHLLLGEATGKALDDEGVLARAAAALGTGPQARHRLSALRLLAEADARAAGPRAWTTVRASLLNRATAAIAVVL